MKLNKKYKGDDKKKMLKFEKYTYSILVMYFAGPQRSIITIDLLKVH